MKCERDDCFAYTQVFENHCSALTDTYRCHFYKTKEELRSQEEISCKNRHGHEVSEMKCERDDCFAYTPVFENHCSALTDTYRCHFYKTKEELRSQEEMLLNEGHPIYRPSKTRAEQRLLKRLLNGERTDDMD